VKAKGPMIGVAVLLPATCLGLVISFVLLLEDSRPAAADCGPAISVSISDDIKVDGYTQEQLKNAAAIMGAGKSLNLSVNGQMISVMVALGESGVEDHCAEK